MDAIYGMNSESSYFAIFFLYSPVQYVTSFSFPVYCSNQTWKYTLTSLILLYDALEFQRAS